MPEKNAQKESRGQFFARALIAFMAITITQYPQEVINGFLDALS